MRGSKSEGSSNIEPFFYSLPIRFGRNTNSSYLAGTTASAVFDPEKPKNLTMNNLTHRLHFWKSHPGWFIPFISELYPLTKFQLLLYEDILDWERIKRNAFIKWSDETRDCFNERLRAVATTSHVLFTIDEMPVQINYQPENNPVYREENPDYFTWWRRIVFGVYILPAHYDQDKVMQLIRHFHCGIELENDPLGGLPIPTDFLRERKAYLDWNILSRYWGLCWSYELLQEFEPYWVTEKLIENHTTFNYCLKNDLSDDFIEKVLD